MSDTNTILFGSDPMSGIVAVEALESEAAIYRRTEDRVIETREPFVP
jgi:hypothetical protein